MKRAPEDVIDEVEQVRMALELLSGVEGRRVLEVPRVGGCSRVGTS